MCVALRFTLAPESELPSSVRSCPEPALDPIKDVIPIIHYLLVERTNGRTVCARWNTPGSAWRAWGNPVDQAIEHDEISILACGVIEIILLAVDDKVVRAHRCNEERDTDILEGAGSGIVARAPIDLLVIRRISRLDGVRAQKGGNRQIFRATIKCIVSSGVARSKSRSREP